MRTLGTTIFLTTHYLEEADALCDRILVIDHGRIVADGCSRGRSSAGSPATWSRCSVGGDPTTRPEGARATAAGSATSRVDGGALRLTVERGEEALPGLLRALDAAGITLESIQLARPTLDDVFLTVTGRSLSCREAHRQARRPAGSTAAGTHSYEAIPHPGTVTAPSGPGAPRHAAPRPHDTTCSIFVPQDCGCRCAIRPG